MATWRRIRQWAEGEDNEEARQGLLDMAGQYERLVAELKARIDAAQGRSHGRD